MDGLVDQFIEKMDNFFGRILFAIERVLCLFISWMQQLFNVFTGVKPAIYNNKKEYLIDIFFGNKLVNGVYMGMAMIGIIMSFVFAIISVTRKGFDLDEKVRQSHGQILRSLMRSIFIIISLSVFMSISISFTDELMKSVNEVFNRAPTITQGENHIEYTDEQYAAMSRIFNTVGNYSLNPSYNNRYNLNTCYNDVRADIKYLADTGVFNYHYPTTVNGKPVNTWQSALQELAAAADYNTNQPVDVYNESIANALNHCIQIIKTDYNFSALKEFDRTTEYDEDSVSLDRVLFLCGTMGVGNDAAAKNDAYNESPDLMDNVRAPYYLGEKDIYDLDQVNEDFYISFSRMNYLLIYLVGGAIVVNMAIIIVNCIVRIFNLLFLYVIAPPVIAVSPLDDGGKLKQWLTAFIVQAFSVFATVISMRIFLIYVPIVMNPSFQLVDNNVVSMIGKLIMIWAGTVAIEKANGLLTGILADNAGWQSIMAGSTAQDVKGSSIGRLASSATNKIEGAAVGAVTAPVSFAADKAKGLATGVAKGAGRLAALPFRPLTGAVSNAVGRFSEGFNELENNASNSLIESSESKQKKQEASAKQQEKNELANERKEQKQFRNMVGSYIASQQANKQPPPPRNNNQNNANPAANQQNQQAQPNQQNQRNNQDQQAQPNQQNNNRNKPLNEKAQKLFGVDANGNPNNRRNNGNNNNNKK